MQSLRVVVVCALACLLLAAGVAAHSGGCGDHEEGDTWQTGPPNTCAEYTCKDGSIRGKTCAPVYSLSSKCKVKAVADGTPYPACCPTLDCP